MLVYKLHIGLGTEDGVFKKFPDTILEPQALWCLGARELLIQEVE